MKRRYFFIKINLIQVKTILVKIGPIGSKRMKQLGFIFSKEIKFMLVQNCYFHYSLIKL